MQRRERRRLAVAVISTAIAIPLLIVEVAPGADASPDATPTAFVADELPADEADDTTDDGAVTEAAAADEVASDPTPRAFGMVTGDELAAPRLFSVFSGGDALRAQAEADALAAEEARLREEEAERQRQIEAEAAERAEAERQRQAEAQAAAEAAAPPPAPAAQPAPTGGPSPDQWHALRQCESSGNYQAVSRNGLYFGAYQFYPGTWDNTARLAGRGDLVGVRPDHASPADQDAMALALWHRRGASPWPHCGAHLT